MRKMLQQHQLSTLFKLSPLRWIIEMQQRCIVYNLATTTCIATRGQWIIMICWQHNLFQAIKNNQQPPPTTTPHKSIKYTCICVCETMFNKHTSFPCVRRVCPLCIVIMIKSYKLPLFIIIELNRTPFRCEHLHLCLCWTQLGWHSA